MKAAKSKTTSSNLQPQNKQASKPFFAKDGEGTFFSEAPNHAVQTQAFFSPSTLQPKLKVGPPNDKYEREADQVADQVVKNPTQTSSNVLQAKCHTCATEEKENKKGQVQPKEIISRKPIFESDAESGGRRVQTKPLFNSITPLIQRQEEEEVGDMQAKLVQRQEEEESGDMQAKFIQRQEEEEGDSVQAKLIQRQAEEESGDVQAQFIQRQEEEEGDSVQGKLIQRQEEEEAGDMQAKLIQRQEEEEPAGDVQAKLEIQMKSAQQTAPDHDFESRLQSTKGQGEPLEKDTKENMESNFGVDFSGVRVHTNPSAVQMSKDIGAQAFTHGNDIYFNSGKYDTASTEGKHLLAHELTHTVQQGASVQRLPEIQREEEAQDYAKELAESEQEAREAIDPIPAQEAKEKAAKEGQAAEEKAAAQAPVVKPKPKETKKKPAKSRVAKAKKRKPDVVKPAESAEEKGEVGKSLEEQSQEVCPQAAGKAQQLADNEQAHDQAGEKLAQTEGAVEPPVEEGQSRSNAAQVDGLEEAPEPQPDPDVARREMDQAIEESVPASIEQMNEFESKGKAEVIGNKVLSKTTEDVGEIQGAYNEIENAPPAQEMETPEQLPELEQAPPTEKLNLGKDAVPSVSEEQTDLSSFEQESDKKLEEEGITEEQLNMVDSGDLAKAKEGRQEVKQKVAEQPAKLQSFAREKQQEVEKDMQEEEEQGKAEMKKKRKKELEETQKKQQKTKSAMELKREKVTQHINSIYEKAKNSVTNKLNNLEKTALARFDRGQQRFSKLFEREVNRDVNAWKRDRYSGFWAGVKWLRDKLLGIDDFPEVKNAFKRGRERYVQRIDGLIVQINKDNQKTIEDCKKELAQAKLEIKKYVDGLGPDLKKTGLAAQKDMQKKLAEMDGFIEKKKKELQDKLCNKKEEAIKAIDEKIEQMKSEMGGLVGKLGQLLLQAMLKFFKWALEKVGGGDKVMGIINKGKSVIMKIVKDPIQFFKNIGKAVGGGIQRFVNNIKKHLINGLISWLTGAMGDTGLQLPDKWDLKGILSLILQVFGLTWTSIRTKLVKRVGEKVVAMAEGAVDIFQRIKAEGPIAIWNIIKEKAAEIKQGVMDGIRNWVITQIVKKATIKLVSMLNPAGAIVQAIIAIYDVVMFFVDNWQRIVDFVKSIFNSITEIAFGRVGQAAAFIEKSMAMMIPILLNFLSRFIGLSGIGKAVKNIIKKLRKPIDKIVNKIIKFLAGKVKKLFKKGKAAVKAVLNWLKVKKRVTFKNGETHTLFFKGKGKNAKLYMKSTEISIENRISQVEDATQKKKLQALYKKEVVDLINRNANKKLSNAKQKELQTKISNSLTKIGKLLGDTDDMLPTAVTHSSKGGRPGKVIAKPLTKKAGNTQKQASGSRSIIVGESLIQKWIQKTGKKRPISAALGVHILAHHLHGPWTKWNIAFGSKSLNENMTAGPEKKAKENRDHELEYNMSVNYFENNKQDNLVTGSNNPSVDDLKKALGFYIAESITGKVIKKEGKSEKVIYSDTARGEFPPVSGEPIKSISELIVALLKGTKGTEMFVSESGTSYVKTSYTGYRDIASDISKNNAEVRVFLRELITSGTIIKHRGSYYIREGV